MNRLIAVAALLVLLSGCAKRPSYLIPTGIQIGQNNVLSFTLANQGDGPVPAKTGNVRVVVDEDAVWEAPLASLSDQSFVQPGGTSIVQTPFRITGYHRRVGVFVDPTAALNDLNVYQKSYSKNITAASDSGPDFVIRQAVSSSSNQVSVTLWNVGTSASSASQSLTFHATVDGQPDASWSASLSTSLQPNASVTLMPSPPLTHAPHNLVRLTFETAAASDEIDNTNNFFTLLIPGRPAVLAPYYALLALPTFAQGICWEGEGGIVTSYASWMPQQKNDLDSAIYALESGNAQPLPGPPVLDSNHWMSDTDAWKIFLAHIAQSLWVEVHGAVPWHIADLKGNQPADLLDSRKLLLHGPAAQEYGFSGPLTGSATSWYPTLSYMFLKNLGLLQDGQAETAWAVINWMRGRVIHGSGDSGFALGLAIGGYDGPAPVEAELYPFYANTPNQVWGCWGSVGLIGMLLRTVNIPTERFDVLLRNPAVPHTGIYFPSIDQYLVHGDDVYPTTLSPSGSLIFATEVLYDTNRFKAKFGDNLPVECSSGNTCNDQAVQRGHNLEKDQITIAYKHPSDYLLYELATGGPTQVDRDLQGTTIAEEINGKLTDVLIVDALPYFDQPTRAYIISLLQGALRDVGNGDAKAGAAAVIKRYEAFNKNKAS